MFFTSVSQQHYSGILHRLSLSPVICLPAFGCRLIVFVMFFFALHYTVSTLFKEVHNNSKNTCTTRQFWVSIKCKEITYNTYRIWGENQSFSWIPLLRANCLLRALHGWTLKSTSRYSFVIIRMRLNTRDFNNTSEMGSQAGWHLSDSLYLN